MSTSTIFLYVSSFSCKQDKILIMRLCDHYDTTTFLVYLQSPRTRRLLSLPSIVKDINVLDIISPFKDINVLLKIVPFEVLVISERTTMVFFLVLSVGVFNL